MPKLDKKTVKAASTAEAWGAGGNLIPAGRYAGRLSEVREFPAGPSGFPSWMWLYKALHNEEGEPIRGSVANFTSLSPKAVGNLKQTYNALGFELDSDTDEMLGEWAVVYVEQEVAKQGKKAGQTVNRVTGIAEFDEAEWDFDPDSVPADTPRESAGSAPAEKDDAF